MSTSISIQINDFKLNVKSYILQNLVIQNTWGHKAYRTQDRVDELLRSKKKRRILITLHAIDFALQMKTIS